MKRVRPAALAILASLLLPQMAQAQLFDADQLAKVEEVEVVFVYEIRPACLLSPGDLKDEAEWVLRNSGIAVADHASQIAHKLQINVVAERAYTQGCAASISTQLVRLDTLDSGSVDSVKESAFVLAYQNRLSLHIGPEPGFTPQLRIFINQSVTALANKIVEARTGR
ncbi:MAG: hypothetical protein GKS02_03410 [Alphaproteobacteria bacterium]|nr:hypothetical protein [Alphaproteobacteria bacterium]